MKKSLSKRAKIARHRKTVATVSLIAQISLLFSMAGVGVFFAPSLATAVTRGVNELNLAPLTNPTIWLSAGACGHPTINTADVGSRIFINGKNFTEGLQTWNITGRPESGDPITVVASGQRAVDSTGDFCFRAYVVKTDDWGRYDVTFGNEQADYRVVNKFVSGRVINDINDGNSNPANGWNWEIKATKGATTKTVTSNYPNGTYFINFSNSEHGDWVISETLKPGWTQTAPAGITYTVHVDNNTHVTNKDFSNQFTTDITACPDMDESGVVDTVDLTYFSNSYVNHIYNIKADFNQDGAVNDVDKAIFSLAYTNADWWPTYCVNQAQ